VCALRGNSTGGSTGTGAKSAIYYCVVYCADKEIVDGSMYLTCQYNGKDLYSNHWDLCAVEDGLEDRVIHCPIRVGRRRFVKELKIPNYLPKVTAFSAYNLFVSFCIDFYT